ncbi:MAG: creatininase family protein [Saprospiraceae bacterium]|nr:creatininase family protein [Saprospiraceae bacterium]
MNCNLNEVSILADANYKTVNETDYKLAVLPWGATEAHNYHLPYATDNYQVEYVAKQASMQALSLGTKSLVLPCVPFGVNTGQLDIKFCMNILPSTQLAILKDLVDVLKRHNIEKLVILNGHGGNNFKNMIRELSFLYPEIFICWVDWFRLVDWNKYFDNAGDHAGEMETSVMLHIRPDLVRPLSEAGDGYAKKIPLSGFREGWAVTQRQWTKVTADTGVGDPKLATAEKGKKYLADCAQKLAHFLTELHQTSNEDLYM